MRKLELELPATIGSNKEKLASFIQVLEKRAYTKATSLDHYQRTLDESVQRLKTEATRVRKKSYLCACMRLKRRFFTKQTSLGFH